MKKFKYLSVVSLLFLCLSTSSEALEKTVEILPTNSLITSVYNHAYQENYTPDSLTTILNSAVNSYVLLEPDDITAEDIISIKKNNNIVSAYISIGTAEKWRADFASLTPYITQSQWAEWQDEYFFKTSLLSISKIMKSRIDKISKLGFDWIEFDNMDFAFDATNRLRYNIQITQDDAIKYYNNLCNYAHKKGLKVMAKNTFRNIEQFDGITLESYDYLSNWWDNENLKAFIKQSKLAVIVHYNDTNPPQTYLNYTNIYGENLLIIIESNALKSYVHFN